MSAPAQLSCDTAEHYLPALYARACVATLGRVDTDPATSEVANREIGAALIYTAERPGQDAEWRGRVLCNPPGDARGELVPIFWARCSEHALAGRGPVLWVGYSLEQLRRLADVTHRHPRGQRWPSPLAWPMAMPRERLRWRTPYVRLAIGGTAKDAGELALDIDGCETRVAVAAGQRAAQVTAVLVQCLLDGHPALGDLQVQEPAGASKPWRVLARHRKRCEYQASVIEKPRGLSVKISRNESPTHGNYFALLGADAAMTARFREEFGRIGCYLASSRRGRRGEIRDLRADVLTALAKAQEPLSARKVRSAVGARNADVLAVLADLERSGAIKRHGRDISLFTDTDDRVERSIVIPE